MDIKDFEFNVGDEVITVDGRRGKIVNICNCERCQSRGFLEPFWLPIDGGTEECISITIAQCDFDGYHRIGVYKFNDFDKNGVRQRIANCESELKKLKEQLIFIEKKEREFTPEKALEIVEGIGKDPCGMWVVPNCYNPCDDTDEVYGFLDYIKALIRKEINHEQIR